MIPLRGQASFELKLLRLNRGTISFLYIKLCHFSSGAVLHFLLRWISLILCIIDPFDPTIAKWFRNAKNTTILLSVLSVLFTTYITVIPTEKSNREYSILQLICSSGKFLRNFSWFGIHSGSRSSQSHWSSTPFSCYQFLALFGHVNIDYLSTWVSFQKRSTDSHSRQCKMELR